MTRHVSYLDMFFMHPTQSLLLSSTSQLLLSLEQFLPWAIKSVLSSGTDAMIWSILSPDEQTASTAARYSGRISLVRDSTAFSLVGGGIASVTRTPMTPWVVYTTECSWMALNPILPSGFVGFLRTTTFKNEWFRSLSGCPLANFLPQYMISKNRDHTTLTVWDYTGTETCTVYNRHSLEHANVTNLDFHWSFLPLRVVVTPDLQTLACCWWNQSWPAFSTD